MAEEGKIAQQRIGQLLRYHRFCLVTAVTKIPEFRFRKYWQQISNTQTLWAMAEEGKVSQSHINALLRYHRFVIAAAITIQPLVGVLDGMCRRRYITRVKPGVYALPGLTGDG
jgi:hypothetical protein